MKKLLIILSLLLLPFNSFAASSSTTVWEFRSGATANMINGGGFDTGNTAFPTDATATVANGNSPVLSSATYNFVAGDVGAWIYIKAGTNWTVGWYQIASVASNQATLSAAIGQAIQINANGNYTTNTVAGCATVASPTGGTFGVDYSQQNVAKLTLTDLATTGVVTTVTSVVGGFTPVMVGNYIHITSGTNFTAGWYEITTYTNTNTIIVDTAPSTAAGSAGVGNTGGALDFTGTLTDAFFEQIVVSNIIWVKAGTYNIMTTAVSVAATSCSAQNPCNINGYNTNRGDNPVGASRPSLDNGTVGMALGVYQQINNVILTGTATAVLTIQGVNRNIKVTNTSGTANRAAISVGQNTSIVKSELSSTAGQAVSVGNMGAFVFGNYIHNSVDGISTGSTRGRFIFNIIEACSNTGINFGSGAGANTVTNNTIFGKETSLVGTGILMANAATTIDNIFSNNIIYGWATPIAQTTTQYKSNQGQYNDIYNNTNPVSNYSLDVTDLALNPTFTNTTTHDFSIGTNLKAQAFPGVFNGSGSTGYLDIGSVQRIETGGGGIIRRR